MQTITTKFHGPTNTRGARISATTSSGLRKYFSYQYDLSSRDEHKRAFEATCKGLGWKGTWTAGDTKTGYIWVCVTDTVKI